jgi:prepilin-type N-terminal cleavage/methylation domain-containing protein/prepilin-type processing-associated H-X9-DG protein
MKTEPFPLALALKKATLKADPGSQPMDAKKSRRGFTLVELLVVLAILLLLLAMLLPAIQKIREAANKVVCASNLRSIGQAMALYLSDSKQYYPSGGGDNPLPRTLTAAGLPALRRDQDWGWLYQILPYLEHDALWKLRSTNPIVPSYTSPYGKDPFADDTLMATAIPGYFCPSRRNPQVTQTPEAGLRAMNDYAGNIGCYTFYQEGGVYHSPCANAEGYEEGKPKNPFRNGIFVKSRFFQSQSSQNLDSLIHARDITDGISHTLLAAEKRMNSSLLGKQQFGDYDGYTAGYIADTLRAGQLSPARDFDSNLDIASDRFGSAHPYSMNALFCDGSVRQISYEIPDNRQVCQAYHPYLAIFGVYPLPGGPPAPTVPHTGPYPPYSIELTLFQRLCHRSDGGTVDLSLID